MQKTSEIYKRIISGPYETETRLAIGEAGVLTDETGDTILFGDTAILVDSGGPDDGYDEDMLISIEKTEHLFQDGPVIGAAASQEVDIEMLKPVGEIPFMARLAIYSRVKNASEVSEWLPQGVFYSDTEETPRDNRVQTIKIHGFDAMLALAEQDYPSSTMDWPAKDVDILQEIAAFLGIDIDPETLEVMDKGYTFPYPAGYSCREVIGFLGGAYAGGFVISEVGDLRLIQLGAIPAETSFLVDEDGNAIVFGIGEENEVVLLV